MNATPRTVSGANKAAKARALCPGRALRDAPLQLNDGDRQDRHLTDVERTKVRQHLVEAPLH